MPRHAAFTVGLSDWQLDSENRSKNDSSSDILAGRSVITNRIWPSLLVTPMAFRHSDARPAGPRGSDSESEAYLCPAVLNSIYPQLELIQTLSRRSERAQCPSAI